jgi:hypothetical protein
LIFYNNEIFPVSIVGNCSVTGLALDEANTQFVLDVTASVNSTGHFDLSIPTNLMPNVTKVMEDGFPTEAVENQNETFTTVSLNFAYGSTHNIQVIGTNLLPEYPSTLTLMPMFSVTSLSLLIMWMRRNKKQHVRQSVD